MDIDGVRLSFDNFSYGDSIRFAALSSKAMKMQILQSRMVGKTKLSTKDEKDLGEALDTVEAMMTEQRYIFSRVVVEIPQFMFVTSAPPVEEMDLTDPDTYLMLKADAVDPLRTLVNARQNGLTEEGEV